MASQVDIYNLALSHLGLEQIASISDTSPSGNACNLFYEPSRDDTFRGARWAFATVTVSLTADAASITSPEWTYIYDYPSTCACMWAVFSEANADMKERQDFEVQYNIANTKKIILTNEADAYGEYTYILTDTTEYDPSFVMALSYKLAANMAHTLIGKEETQQSMMNGYQLAISEAKRIGSIEKRKKPTQESSYVNAR